MTTNTQQPKLNVPFTVEATLHRAKGELLTQCLAGKPHSGSIIKFDVRYPGERIPATIHSLANTQNPSEEIDFSKDPVYISIDRLDMGIAMLRDETVMPHTGRRVVSYSIVMRHHNKGYQAVMSTNNFEKEYGSREVLEAVQKDAEFSQYISFIHNGEVTEALKDEKTVQPWNLLKLYEKSRGE